MKPELQIVEFKALGSDWQLSAAGLVGSGSAKTILEKVLKRHTSHHRPLTDTIRKALVDELGLDVTMLKVSNEVNDELPRDAIS